RRAEAVPGLARLGRGVDLAGAAEDLLAGPACGEAAAAVHLVADLRQPQCRPQLVVQARVAQLVLADAEAAEVRPVPVGAPVVDVAGHVVAAVGAHPLGVQADGGGPADEVVEIGQRGDRPGVAPGPEPAVGAAGGLLPLGVGGQAPADPAGVGVGLEPAHAGHRLVRAVEACLAPHLRPRDLPPGPPGPALRRPPAWLLVAAGVEELHEADVGDGEDVDPEGGQEDLAGGFFVLLGEKVALGPAHQEGTGRDPHHRGTVAGVFAGFAGHPQVALAIGGEARTRPRISDPLIIASRL